MTEEMFEMMWSGVFVALQFLFWTAIWCLACAIINKGVGG